MTTLTFVKAEKESKSNLIFFVGTFYKVHGTKCSVFDFFLHYFETIQLKQNNKYAIRVLFATKRHVDFDFTP